MSKKPSKCKCFSHFKVIIDHIDLKCNTNVLDPITTVFSPVKYRFISSRHTAFSPVRYRFISSRHTAFSPVRYWFISSRHTAFSPVRYRFISFRHKVCPVCTNVDAQWVFFLFELWLLQPLNLVTMIQLYFC